MGNFDFLSTAAVSVMSQNWRWCTCITVKRRERKPIEVSCCSSLTAEEQCSKWTEIFSSVLIHTNKIEHWKYIHCMLHTHLLPIYASQSITRAIHPIVHPTWYINWYVLCQWGNNTHIYSVCVCVCACVCGCVCVGVCVWVWVGGWVTEASNSTQGSVGGPD